MNEAPFISFHKAFPPDGNREPYDATRFAAFANRVPAEFLSEWRQIRFGSFGRGLLWMHPPDEAFLGDGDWRGLHNARVEILRSAFGDVFIWQGGRFHWHNIYSGRLYSFSANPEVAFHGVSNKDFRKTLLLERIFNIACDRLGYLTKDECYGFAPLPTLGGAIAEKYLIKTRMREYVAMVPQTLGNSIDLD